MQDDRQIIISPSVFLAPKVMEAPEGLTIMQIVTRMYEVSGTHPACRYYDVLVEIDGVPVPRSRWDVIPPADAHVLIHAHVHGGRGKNPLRTILTILVVVVAAAATWYAGGAGGWGTAGALGLKGAAAAGYGAVVGAAVSTAGMLLVDAIAPIRQPSQKSRSYSDSDTYFIQGARNQIKPYDPVPVILGRHKMVPPLGTKPYTELLGNDEYLRMLFVWGYGPLKIENIRIGDTPIENYEGVEIETVEGREGDPPLTLMPDVVETEGIGIELVHADGPITRTAKAGAKELSVDILFPHGLLLINKKGKRYAVTVSVSVEYREIGAATWTAAHTFTVTDKTTSAIRRGFRWKVNAAKQYEIRLNRITRDIADDHYLDTVTWSVMRSFIGTKPVPFPHPLAMTAIRIKATDQLQGIIDNLSGIVSSYAPVWDKITGKWSGEAVTSNPAALFRLVLTSNANARKRSSLQINDDNLGEFYEFCEAGGYKFNMVRDFQASVWDTLGDIAAAARAAPCLPDGKWGVTMDDADKPVVQHISPRNSWGFQAEKTLYHHPHAFRVRFNNELDEWNTDERIVYDDGYSAVNATLFEAIEFPGITCPDLAWKFGRYHIAQARLRPETYSVYMDYEHLVCRRGSKVRISHDVPLWGSGYGRVKSITTDGDNTTGVVLDDKVPMEAGKNYVCRFRLADADNTSLLLSVNTVVGETSELTFQSPVPTASGPQAGDLAMFGQAERETVELLVKGIERADDLVARLILVDVGEAIYDADKGTIPPFNPSTTSPMDISRIAPPAPQITRVESGTAALLITATGITSRIFVTLQASGTMRVDKFIVRYRDVESSPWSYAEAHADSPTAILSPVSDGESYEIQAQSVSIYGPKSSWSASVYETVVGQSEPPADVTGFACNIISSGAHLSWDPLIAADLSHYRIRWSPLTSGATWAGSVDLVTKASASSTAITVPAMIGSYLIKGVDYSGSESAVAAVATSSIARVAGLNYVASIESPPWEGTADGLAYFESSGGLRLILDTSQGNATLVESGHYTFGAIDLVSVYTSRVSAQIDCVSVDLLSDLYDHDDLYAIPNLYGDVEGKTDAWLEISTTNDDPAGTPAWSDWMPFIIGDYTARAFRFRVYGQGTPPSITPVITRVVIGVDMEDRTVSFAETIPVGGTRISFDSPFAVPPEIGIAILNGQEGDYYEITNKNEGGFDIVFTNGGASVSRNITGIAKAYGAKEVI